MEVNANNIHDYVRRYSEHRMLKIPDKALKVIIIISTTTCADTQNIACSRSPTKHSR